MTKIKVEIESSEIVENTEIHLNYKDGKTEVQTVDLNGAQKASQSSSDLFPSVNTHHGIDSNFMDIANS